MTRLKSPRSYDLQLFPRDGVGIERDVSRVRVLAKHQKLRTVAAVFDAFIHGVRMSHALDDYVGSEAAGGVDDLLAAFGEIRHGVGFDDDIGAEFAREFEAMRRAADGDGFRGTRLDRDREGREADRTRTLNDYGIAPGYGTALDSVNGRGQGAARADDRLRAEVIGNAKNRGASAPAEFFRRSLPRKCGASAALYEMPYAFRVRQRVG